MTNIWQEVKDFINNKSAGTIIERKEIKQLLHGKIPEKKPYGGYTFDKYLRYLTLHGFLEHCDKGKYKLLQRIPTNVSSERAKQVAYKKRTYEKVGILDI